MYLLSTQELSEIIHLLIDFSLHSDYHHCEIAKQIVQITETLLQLNYKYVIILSIHTCIYLYTPTIVEIEPC